MASEDKHVEPQRSSAARLADLEQRLDSAFGRLGRAGDRGIASHGESLRARRARLHARVQAGTDDASVANELESLTDEVDRWVTHVDQTFATGTARTIR